MAKAIQTAFKKSGLLRSELARRANVPYSTVHRFMESYRDVGLQTVQKLADVLNLELRPVKRKRR